MKIVTRRLCIVLTQRQYEELVQRAREKGFLGVGPFIRFTLVECLGLPTENGGEPVSEKYEAGS